MNHDDTSDDCLRTKGWTDEDIEALYRQIDAEDAAAKSIAEGPVWKAPLFDTFEKLLTAARLEKSRETTKHYVDSAGQPTRPANMMADGRIDVTKSIMGNPVRNPDGTVSWVVK